MEELQGANKKCNELTEKYDEANNKLSQKDSEINDLRKQETNIKQKCEEMQEQIKRFNEAGDEFFRGIESLFEKPSNPKEALNYFEHSSAKGNSYGSYLVGILYEKSIEVEKDIDKSIKYFTKSFEEGNTYGNIKIGNIYEKGAEIE